jgi:hypothetical protein
MFFSIFSVHVQTSRDILDRGQGEFSSAQPFGIKLKRQADYQKYTSFFAFIPLDYRDKRGG